MNYIRIWAIVSIISNWIVFLFFLSVIIFCSRWPISNEKILSLNNFWPITSRQACNQPISDECEKVAKNVIFLVNPPSENGIVQITGQKFLVFFWVRVTQMIIADILRLIKTQSEQDQKYFLTFEMENWSFDHQILKLWKNFEQKVFSCYCAANNPEKY